MSVFTNVSGISSKVHYEDAQSGRAESSRERTGLRVLVVEDDAVICLDLRETLLEAGFEVAEVTNSVETALSAIRRYGQKLDCVILDVQLNEETCLPITRSLDDIGVPYIIVTGHDRETIEQLELAAPIVQKPFECEELVACLQRVATCPSQHKLTEKSDASRLPPSRSTREI